LKTPLRFFACAAALALTTGHLSAAAILVSDSAAFQQAINSAPDGSVIELAAGNYTPPSGGFTRYNSTGALTIRAAPGAAVALNGGSATDLFRFTNSQKPTTFQGINFNNGLSNSNFIGAAMTIDNAEAIFVGCSFQNNATNGSITGGGVWINASKILFQSCNFMGNTSPNYGAAFSALNSEVFVNGSRFSNNRANLANHNMNSAGGAINANGTLLRIANCKFEGNQAGLAGGAIYAYGPWRDPFSTPATRLIVANSTFIGNMAIRGPGGPPQSPAIGGAVFAEDQTSAQFFNCRFTSNSARLGGAVASYRATVEVVGSVFRDNQATGTAADESIGGSIISLSADNVDGSTDGGKINRPSSQLTVRDTLIQGVPGVNSAGRGGGIFASGDLAAAYGIPPFAQQGTIESNRATVSLTRVAFVNLSANGDNALGSGLGGAFQGDFASLTADSVIVTNCHATNYGGGFRLAQNSVLNLTNTTVAQVTAAFAGAGITMFSGSLNLTKCNFVQNSLTTGFIGTAITTGAQPANGNIPALDVSGLVTNCVFSNNGPGPVIYDSEPFRAGPYNRVQYSSNQIFSPPRDAYFNELSRQQTVDQLNALTMSRADGSSDKKAPSPNFAPTSAPSVGAILLLPRLVLSSGGPDEAVPIAPSLAYASNGEGGVRVDGVAQRAISGVIDNVSGGPHSLMVGNNSFVTAPPPAAALNIATRLQVGAGENALIGGFIIVGPTPKRVMLRAIGPSLTVAGALADPNLVLHDGTGAVLARNDNWRSTQAGGLIPSKQEVEIHGSTIPPGRDEESAMIVTLNPGAYTAVVRGFSSSTGIAIIEAYDLDADQSSTLANISTRGFILENEKVMIGGFIFGGGPAPTKVLIRGMGPSLKAQGVLNPLLDPVLELFDGNGRAINFNDDWKTNRAAIEALGMQPSNDAESAILVSNLAPGGYTAQLKGKNSGIGIGVLEVYIFE
jgi:hypothetical protein